jgi:hypothetical protein
MIGQQVDVAEQDVAHDRALVFGDELEFGHGPLRGQHALDQLCFVELAKGRRLDLEDGCSVGGGSAADGDYGYASLTSTLSMLTGSVGRSCAPVAAVAILSTTSSPEVSLPKMV